MSNNDLISRKALLKVMEEERQYLLARGVRGAEHILVHHCLPLIDNAPTVEAVEFEYHSKLIKQAYQKGKDIRAQGEWISVDERLPEDMVVCSNCQTEFSWDAETGVCMDNYKTCPNCGADMRGEEE